MKCRMIISVVMLVSVGAMADPLHHEPTDAGGPGATVSADVSEGTIRQIDRANGRVTIKHGPLANLGMQAMTMVFQVKDPAWLTQIKEGDEVHFHAERIDGVLTVVKLERARP